MTQVQQIRQEIRETRAEMKAMGIKRSSFMNGSHSADSYRLNAHMFALETKLGDAKREAEVCKCGTQLADHNIMDSGHSYSQASELDADEYDAGFRKQSSAAE